MSIRKSAKRGHWRFFNNSWNEVLLFLKRHPVVWILVAESFLMQTIFLSHLTFDFRGYPRELVFHGRTSLRNVINHGLCKCSFKEGPVIFYSKVSWSWSKEVLSRIGHGLSLSHQTYSFVVKTLAWRLKWSWSFNIYLKKDCQMITHPRYSMDIRDNVWVRWK